MIRFNLVDMEDGDTSEIKSIIKKASLEAVHKMSELIGQYTREVFLKTENIEHDASDVSILNTFIITTIMNLSSAHIGACANTLPVEDRSTFIQGVAESLDLVIKSIDINKNIEINN